MVTDRGRPGVRVPAGRLSRLARLGGLAGGIAGRAAFGGLRQIAGGAGPGSRDLLLTPANAQRVAGELARLRGAAMKVGQFLSMDAGEVLPPEIAAILDRLRSDADPMPPRQLRGVLDAEWGPGWLGRFRRFDVRPIAAASIGQVHRAVTRDGRELALKVQYPGVRASIDSDIANIAGLIRWSGAAPRGLDLAPLMAEARAQLHEEADYIREGRNLDLFGALLAGDPAFLVPKRHPDLCTPNVLAMEYVTGLPVERLAAAPQELRDETARRLIDLTLRELFELGRMQTDPNFANYLVEAGGRIVLLDFGAVRQIAPGVQEAFRRLMRAGLSRDRAATETALEETGLIGPGLSARHREIVLLMFDLAMSPLRSPGPFDFGASDLPLHLRDMGMEMGVERAAIHVPPVGALLIQRKVAGMYLLAARLRARVDLTEVVGRFVP
ncbi:ABC1 kinase family protein [Wenxinia saemankumensis]|uniref:Predicted unusual protein kinase regulating ubiquinone biosynthesis, AarF/ABC1/UbiB family n=1 Tax=Wenxinia saemankumensis TaxID=1447782 RepID=A0A1M6B3R3_9RHOB|nr:AarF/ABC1/UbiB kinase family protein [Wenxinia saemankumensis]SHI43093.1 Predicted unusual protein kinase regulating ubiquinone biosynthesis, AarF/ABC1/UbiB family [Wenxinia saemankumensis]